MTGGDTDQAGVVQGNWQDSNHVVVSARRKHHATGTLAEPEDGMKGFDSNVKPTTKRWTGPQHAVGFLWTPTICFPGRPVGYSVTFTDTLKKSTRHLQLEAGPMHSTDKFF